MSAEEGCGRTISLAMSCDVPVYVHKKQESCYDVGEQNQAFLPSAGRQAYCLGSLKHDRQKKNLLLGLTHGMAALRWALDSSLNSQAC